jgi:SAM-dependent methyltransferase
MPDRMSKASAGWKKLVAAGYDTIGDRYLNWTAGSQPRLVYLRKLMDLLPAENGEVLELGCGAGLPVTRVLAERCKVTGVDISTEQIGKASRAVPHGKFLCADMMAITFPPVHFDAVVAFYSITHLPRSEHAVLLSRIANWLRPGGWFVASLGSKEVNDAVVADWLGAPNFFSHFDAATNLQLLKEAGLDVVEQAILPQDEEGEKDVEFLWVIARKAARTNSPDIRS